MKVLFNSPAFAVFLPAVFFLYWFAFNRNIRYQNGFLLVASYFFYSWWDWRFLFLLISISFYNYFIGLRIQGADNQWKRKAWLAAGLIADIGVLGVFKYFNFFIDGFVDIISLFGFDGHASSLKIVLPLGISFYIFLTLSYILDIYKSRLPAEKNILNALLAFGFFPIILAGPIQRPSSLLPQIRSPRKFNYDQAVDGMRQIIWGLFVKIAVADNLAPWADQIFASYADYPGSALLAGALYYTVQIYADFSGYSHIAIGTASLLGFRLMKNFDYPYFSRDISEFWKKWHISLTTWFRDYIFLPLSFAISWKIKKEKVIYIRTDLFIYFAASIVTWLLTGLWHGANYTFIVWGLLHGLLLIGYHFQRNPRKKILKRYGLSNKNLFILIPEGIVTFCLVVLTWIIFRSETITDGFNYIGKMLSGTLFSSPGDLPLKEIFIASAFLVVEFIQRHKEHAMKIENIRRSWLRWSIYITVVLIILIFGGGAQKFIYFQF